MIPPGAFFDLREIAIRANRAASGCPLLAVELPVNRPRHTQSRIKQSSTVSCHSLAKLPKSRVYGKFEFPSARRGEVSEIPVLPGRRLRHEKLRGTFELLRRS